MASFNRVSLMGHLVGKPELRFTSNGAAVATLRMAVNENYTTKDGEKKEEVSFFNVVAWGNQGENAAEHLEKGQAIFVDGRLKQRNWETPEGQKRSTIDIIAGRIIYLAKAGSGGGGHRSTDDDLGSADIDDLGPF